MPSMLMPFPVLLKFGQVRFVAAHKGGAEFDTLCQRVSLKGGSQAAQFRIMPLFKTRSKGSAVCVDDPVSLYLTDIYTITANLAGVPGVALPAGFANGLPLGMQLLGPYFSEARLLNIAHQYQQVTDWHQRAPAGY